MRLGDVDSVGLLLQAGADTEARDARGRTPLLWAGLQEDGCQQTAASPELIRLLVEAGANVNARATQPQTEVSYGCEDVLDTPLLQAVKRGDVETTTYLLAAGADLDAQNLNGQTALMIAAGADQRELIELLLKSGADVTLRDEVGKTALNYTIYASEAYRLMGGEVARLEVFDYVRWADAESLEAVLKNTNIDVNVVDLYGQHLLIYAAGNNPDARVIEVLVAHGANLNQVDIYGWTALIHAARDNTNTEVLLALIKAGANLEHKNTRGMTALMVAAEDARPDAVKTLLESGAKMSACHSDVAWCGYTALHYAAIGGDVETLGLLLEVQQDIVDFNALLAIALDKNPRLEIIQALLALGADPNFEVRYAHDNSFAYTLLARAIASGSLAKVQLMVEAGANVNFQNNPKDRTLLMLAASEGNVPIMEYLLDAGADPTVKLGDEGYAVRTALDFYHRYKTDEYKNPEGEYDEAFAQKLLELTLE